MAQCTQCTLDLETYHALDGGICPNCGGKTASTPALAPIGPGATMNLFGRFWKNTKELLFTPGRFFAESAQSLVSEGGLSTALAYAVIIQWFASFFNFVWRSTVGVMVQSRVNDLFRIAGDVMDHKGGFDNLDEVRQRATEFLFGAGAIVLTPFTTLLKLLFTTLLVHAAVRFFIKESADRPHSFSTTLKILAYSSAPWIFCIIPGFGMLLAYVLSFTAATIGIRVVYRTSTTRAVIAVAFPELLLTVLLMGVGLVFLFMAFNVLRLVF